MIKQVKRFILTLLLLYFTSALFGQEGNMIFMDAAPQNSFFNPAIQYNRSLVLLSLTGSAEIRNNTFSFKNFYNYNTVSRRNYWDLDYLSRNSKSNSSFTAEAFYTLFYVGLKLKNDYYASFYLNRKHNNSFLLPDDVFNLSLGNADYELEKPRQFNFDNAAACLSSHMEYSFGLSKEVSPFFRLGVHLKVLNGLSITKIDDVKASITTADDFSSITIKSDVQIYQSAANLGDSLSTHTFSKNVLGFDNCFKNWGAAIDFGFWFKPSKNITLMGSVTDVGFINWSVDKHLLAIKGEYQLGGISILPSDTGLVVESSFDSLEDTITSLFSPTVVNNSSFISRLYSNVYFAAKWQVSDPVALYAMYRAKGLLKYTVHYVTAGIKYKATERIRLSLSTSIKNATVLNVGAGFLWEHSLGQFFVVSENLGSVFLADRDINAMIGINLFVWQNKKNKKKSRSPFSMR